MCEPEVVLPMRQLATMWQQLFPVEQCRLAQLLIERVVIADGGLEIVWRDRGWHELAGELRKCGVRKVVVRPDGQVEAPGKVATQHDRPLLVALTRAFYWQQLLDDGVVASGSEIAQREGLHHSTVNELLRLTLLEFQRNPLPTAGAAQRDVVAGFDGDRATSPRSPSPRRRGIRRTYGLPALAGGFGEVG